LTLILKQKVYDLIYEILEEKLKKKEKYVHEEMNNTNKQICEEVKNKLRDDINQRYKILVHCIIGMSILIKIQVKEGDKE